MSLRTHTWTAVLVLAACADDFPADSNPAVAIDPGSLDTRGRVLASVARDGLGSITEIDVDPPWPVAYEVAPTGDAAVLRRFGKRLFVVNSGSGTVDIRDPATYELMRTVDLGPGSQPMDVVVVNRRTAYISDFNAMRLHALDLLTGAVSPGPDLSFYADSDGLPEVAMMESVGAEIFVQIQRFDRATGTENGAFLAVIPRLSTGAAEAAQLPGIALQGIRPSFKMQVDPERKRLFVCTPGVRSDHFDFTGIEEIDLSAKQSLGFFVTEAQIGGDIGPFVMVRPDKGFVAWHTSIVLSTHISPFVRGATLGQIRMSGDGWVDAIAYDPVTDQVFYAEPSIASAEAVGEDGAVYVFDAETDLELGGVSAGGAVNDLEVVRF